nr:hypothetical protein [Mycobacterium arosiense]
MMFTLLAAAIVLGPTSSADPQEDPDFSDLMGLSGYPSQPTTPSPVIIKPLPPITPRPSNWQPSFPYPYDQVKGSVTDTDFAGEQELCQWYNAQYDELVRQIDALQFARITPNGPGVINGSGSDWDYSFGNLQQQADILTTNIDQSVDFLEPRVQAFTTERDYVGDVYTPLDGAKSFYLLWQHLSNVNAGIKSHQPDWFTGPSVQRVKRNGSVINRAHICRY